MVTVAQVAGPKATPSHASLTSSTPSPHDASGVMLAPAGPVFDGDEQPTKTAKTTAASAAIFSSKPNFESFLCDNIFCDPFRSDILSL